MVSCRSSKFTQIYSHRVIVLIITLFTLATTASPVSAQDGILGDAVPVTTSSAVLEAQMSGCGGAVMPTSNADFEAEIVVLTNQIRVDHGLLPLKRTSMLENASRYHATDMAVDDYFAHNTKDIVNGQFVETCTWSSRIQTYYTGWSALAENIAAGYPNAESVVEGWMESEGHRNNILNDKLSEIGIGYYNGAGMYRHYWVQDFGSRRNVYPLVVDLDAPVTDSGAVTLHLHGDWQQVRLRTNEGPWSDWIAFQQGMSWPISGNAGEYTVYAEMRNGDKTATSSDTIYLAQSNVVAPKLNPLPDQLAFTYYSQQQMFNPSTHSVRPLDAAVDGYRWQITVEGNWLTVTPAESTNADAVEMRVELSGASRIQNSTTTVTVSLLDANNNVVDSHVTSVLLEVNADALEQIFLPSIVR